MVNDDALAAASLVMLAVVFAAPLAATAYRFTGPGPTAGDHEDCASP